MRASTLILVAFASAGCAPQDSPLSGAPLTAAEAVTVPAFGGDPEREVVFQSIRVLDPSGRVLSSEEKGALTLEAWQRAARPWTYLDEPYAHHEQTWQRALGGGRVEHGYRVIRTPSALPARRASRPAPPKLGPGVAEIARGTGAATVVLTLRDFPAWNVPLIPSSPFLSEADARRGLAEREAALRARKSELAARAQGVLAYLESAGAEIQGLGAGSGWIVARVPARALVDLAARTDLSSIDISAGHGASQSGEETFAEDDGAPDPGGYKLGQLGHPSRLDSDRFRAAGFTGETPNDLRQAFRDIVVATNEGGYIEDEACAWRDGPCTGPSRLRETYACDGTIPGKRCRLVQDFPDPDEDEVCCADDPSVCDAMGATCVTVPASLRSTCKSRMVCHIGGFHATGVMSIIGADYRDGQGNGQFVGDPQCPADCTQTSCPNGCNHGIAFRSAATGIAPEASLVFFGLHRYKDDATIAESLMGAAERHVDVLSNSWTWTSPETTCNPNAILALEKEAEDLYDDGVFVVFAAGNTTDVSHQCKWNNDLCTANAQCCSGTCVAGHCSAAACNVGSPADLPKVFAVNGLPAGGGCNYRTGCVPQSQASSIGGGTVNVANLGEQPGALSMISAAAPTGMQRVTLDGGPRGTVTSTEVNAGTVGFGGSSGATPVVAGAAALVKGLYLHLGMTEINLPGRLFTVMLAMTDRHYDHDGNPATPTVQRLTGADPLFGFGRLKLRRFSEDGLAGTAILDTLTTSSPAPLSRIPFATPLAAGTSLVKCVLLQEEDMSSKDTVSYVSLSVEIREPVDGGCAADGNLAMPPRSDDSYDVKKMVAVTAADLPLGGKCANVVVTPHQIAAVDGVASLTVHVMCYASTIMDDAWLPDSDGDGLADVDETAMGTNPFDRDTDHDGLDDGTEVNDSQTSPLSADTDGDGVGDASDPVTTPPAISVSASPSILWPPDHRMVPITVSVTSDYPSYECAAFSDEPQTGPGGDTAPDVEVIDGQIYVRAERSGNGAGRTYDVICTTSDPWGNEGIATDQIFVPHDQSCHVHAETGLLCCD
jgi:subtilase family protein